MSQLPYDSIPDAPENLSAAGILSRMIDGLGFRYQLATEGLGEKELSFSPSASSWDMNALLQHLYGLSLSANRTFGGSHESAKPFESFDELRAETLRLYSELGLRLRTMNDDELTESSFHHKGLGRDLSFWFLINGHIADALTHVGQVVSWRRIAGNPQPGGVSVLLGKSL